MTRPQTKQQLDLLVDWYETLTPESARNIHRFYATDVRFKDPFNDVRGIAAIVSIYQHMFRTTTNSHFVVQDRLVDDDQAFITWAFRFGLKGRPYEIIGSTHFKFNADGLVVLHRDYWDVAEELLQKLPFVGGFIRRLCGLFKTSV